jgi:hypothetical protein
MSEVIQHTFTTKIAVDRFTSVVAHACKARFQILLEAHDRRMVPSLYIYAVDFGSIEDRDRARIALRFIDPENSDLGAPAAPQRLAHA